MVINDRRTGESRTLDDITLAMPGEHNLLNSTAAIAVAINLGVSDKAIRKGLSGFSGVKRRFTLAGSSNGIDVYDDYGHHPVEITAVLKAARGSLTSASSLSCSRIAIRGLKACSRISARVSMMPIR